MYSFEIIKGIEGDKMLGIMAFIGFSVAFTLLLWFSSALIDWIGEGLSKSKE
ncbi:hypothetical protein Clole_2004 [Cellulosilyticum lentocellum DSM 5427]|uniref:Uncharacterized protein n=1 Tax=Cellulosilyticum lentocellum (strain ATCC 49066 / DSM 5427 / NCIMB 11756 / RHM5) TaxID=642492 RepID=F2JPQ9_CELLD|nr:hypothetical protein Clole_2004 [Cellulosilyticum lentocellum DSM 5427]